ncbi:MAG TPA: choice-of-anchor tandem repeat GloVer-containing protein, partial [Candidatus Acidoferrales bacterium]|nr:choice-of-anchor tandem repeat GloVer-containing protein [Candidatus Acidoferrales bacterium]
MERGLLPGADLTKRAGLGFAVCLAMVSSACSSLPVPLVPSSGLTAPAPGPNDLRSRPAAGFEVLHTFESAAGGSQVTGSPIVLSSVVYGTTRDGGFGKCRCGKIFAISQSGTERTLYSFTGGRGGSWPVLLTSERNSLYGSTTTTVFRITPGGAKTTTLETNYDRIPQSLTAASGHLYGTTLGGSHDDGAVVELMRDGRERVAYSFSDQNQAGGLRWWNGALYGTQTEET